MYRSSLSGVPSLDEFHPNFWQLAFALAAALLIQSFEARYLMVRGATIGWVTLLIAWYGMRAGTIPGAIFGLIAGTCEDALGGVTGVAWTFASAAAGALAGRLGGTPLVDSLWTGVPTLVALGLFRFAAFTIALQLQAHADAVARDASPRHALADAPRRDRRRADHQPLSQPSHQPCRRTLIATERRPRSKRTSLASERSSSPSPWSSRR